MISAIIPVFNTEEACLKRCIQSILAQTYDDFEVIIVDDGSQEACAIVLDEIQKQDLRIHIWHIKNNGVSHARNFGIGMSKGEFICFIDSDDTIEADFFQEALENFEDDIDLLCGKTWQVQVSEGEANKIDVSTRINCDCIYHLETLEEKENVIRCAILGETQEYKGIRPEVWCKMFRRSILEDLKFNEKVAIGEDQIFMSEYLMKCRGVKVLNSFWYSYYVYTSSSLRKRDAEKAEKYILYFEGLHNCLNETLADHLLPEKAGTILKELINAYGVNQYSDNISIKEAYRAYKKLKKNSLVKTYLKRIPLDNRTVGRLEAVCCRLGFSRVGIRLALWRVCSIFR